MEIKVFVTKWNGKLVPLVRENIDSIALHHMAHSSADVYEIDRWHKNNGWAGIGYGWWISKQGEIYACRGFNKNAGVEDENGHILSVGFQGDYDNKDKEMPVMQFNAGVWLCKYLMKEVPTIRVVDGHKLWNSTVCPGKYFPLVDMVTAIFKPETVHWAEKYFDYMNDHGVKVNDKNYDNLATRGEVMAMVARCMGCRD